MSANRIDVQIDSFTYPKAQRAHLNNIRLNLDGGVPYTLFGASGSGKSTLLAAMLPEPEGDLRGRVCYYSEQSTMTPAEVCRNGQMGFMGQSPSLLPWRTVRENLMVPVLLNREHLSHPKESALEAILESVSLPSAVLGHLPHQLSFGMKQRVAFARALLYQPRFLLLDEVYTGLDVATVDIIESYLVRYTGETGAVTLIVTHNVETTQRNAHHLLFMENAGTLRELPTSTTTENLINRFVAELKLL